MKSKYTIGIDIGGTNTDAVLVNNERKIICSYHKIQQLDRP